MDRKKLKVMARAPSTRNKNLSIRKDSKMKIFKKELRTRNKKQQNISTETTSLILMPSRTRRSMSFLNSVTHHPQ